MVTAASETRRRQPRKPAGGIGCRAGSNAPKPARMREGRCDAISSVSLNAHSETTGHAPCGAQPRKNNPIDPLQRRGRLIERDRIGKRHPPSGIALPNTRALNAPEGAGPPGDWTRRNRASEDNLHGAPGNRQPSGAKPAGSVANRPKGASAGGPHAGRWLGNVAQAAKMGARAPTFPGPTAGTADSIDPGAAPFWRALAAVTAVARPSSVGMRGKGLAVTASARTGRTIHDDAETGSLSLQNAIAIWQALCVIPQAIVSPLNPAARASGHAARERRHRWRGTLRIGAGAVKCG